VPVGASGCTNPHVFAIEGRNPAACGFAGISHYELLIDAGEGGRMFLDAAQQCETLPLDIQVHIGIAQVCSRMLTY
jgi:hypothetical protein